MGVSHLLPILGSDFSAGEGGTIFSKFQVNLGSFYSGPFEVLLSRVDEGQITLMDISLTDITSAFLVFLGNEKNISINAAAEFLFIASYLLELKAKSLLPAHKEEEEVVDQVEDDLIARLEQYKVFKEVAESLKQKREHFKYFRAREHMAEGIKRPIKLVDVGLKDLVVAFSRVCRELEKRGEIREIAPETITVEDKVKEICERLLAAPEGLDFMDLFLGASSEGGAESGISYLEVIVTFLAILELAKRRIIRIIQGDAFGAIKILGVVD